MRETLTTIKPDESIAIRHAGYRDVEKLVVLGEHFHREVRDSIVAWNAESARETLYGMIDSPDSILLVSLKGGDPVGMAGGIVFPAYFNREHITGQELFWWVEPEHRNGVGSRLLDALEEAARARGAESWAMGAMATIRPEAVGRGYERRGYERVEIIYKKALV